MTDDERRAEPDPEPDPERPSFLATEGGGLLFLVLVFVSLAIPLAHALFAQGTFGWAATLGLLSVLAIPLLLVHAAARRKRR
ncbi:MAG: hypothetical protein U0234_05560 [Sandaracinus sp.]